MSSSSTSMRKWRWLWPQYHQKILIASSRTRSMASSLPFKIKWLSWILSFRKALVEVLELVRVMLASAMACKLHSVMREVITQLNALSKLITCRCWTSVKATKWMSSSHYATACRRQSKIVWASGWIHNKYASNTIKAWMSLRRTPSYYSHSIVNKSTLILCCQWQPVLAHPICNSLSSHLNSSSNSFCNHNNNSWWGHLRLNHSISSSNNKSHLKLPQHPIWCGWWPLTRMKLPSIGVRQDINNL